MPYLADYLLKDNQYSLSAQEPTRPLGEGGLYRLSSKPRESFIPESVPNQPPQIQGLVPAQKKTDNTMANVQNALSIVQSLAGKPSVVAPQEGILPGQPKYPGSMVAVNMPSDGRTGMAKAENSMMDYWKKPVVGKMPLDQFVTLAGMAANAFAPDTPQGRLGGGLARMAGNIYGERMRQEYESPDVALERGIRQEQLNRLRKPETVSWKTIEPETGREITHYGRPEDRPSETITGIPKTKDEKRYVSIGAGGLYDTEKGLTISPTKKSKREIGIKYDEKTKKWFKGHYDEEGNFTARRPLTKAELEKQVTGTEAKKTDNWLYSDKKQYEYLLDKLWELDKQLKPDDYNDVLSEAEINRILTERDTILNSLKTIEQNVYGGGMAHSEAPRQPVKTDIQNAVKTVKDLGFSRADMKAFTKNNPFASTQEFLNYFMGEKDSKPTSAEIPNMKNEPIKTAPKETAEGMQRQNEGFWEDINQKYKKLGLE